MRAEERDLARDLGGEPREPRFAVDREVVARLDLERRRALRVQLGGQPAESGTQFVVARSPCRGDRATDAARGIRHPGHPCLELVGPVAAEHEVRMAVDEPRHDGAPPGIHDVHRAARLAGQLAGQLAARHRLCAETPVHRGCLGARTVSRGGGVGGGDVRRAAGPGDAAAADEHRGVADETGRIGLVVAEAHGVRRELADAGDQQIGHGVASIIGTCSPRSRATSRARS